MYKIILAIRYLIRRRITYLAVLAVALCVFIVVVVMTVMTGLVRDFKIKNHNWVGDCAVSSDSLVGFPRYEGFIKVLEEDTAVEAVSPVVKSYALLTHQSGWSDSVEIMGLRPARHCRVTNFGGTVYYHKDDCLNVFKPGYDANLPGCVVGIDRVVVREERGQYTQQLELPQRSYAVSCFPLTARGGLARAGLDLVNTKTFYYSDNSHSGLARVDGSFVYLPFEDAQTLCGMDGEEKRVSAIYIKFKPDVKLEAGCEKVNVLWQKFVAENKNDKNADLLSKVSVQSWKDYRRETIAPMEKEQVMMMAGFAMIGIITPFIILVVFYMIISHKSRDIGILKSIGVSRTNLIRLFLGFAFLVGVLGSAAGAFFGWLFLLKINEIENWLFEHFRFQLWDRAIYAIGDIPNQVEFKVLVIIVISAIATCLVGAFIPSWQAARLKPVDTLQVSQL